MMINIKNKEDLSFRCVKVWNSFDIIPIVFISYSVYELV